MIKASPWVIMLIGAVVIPLLKKLIPQMKAEAAKTETQLDDALVGAFEVVCEALETGNIFTPKK